MNPVYITIILPEVTDEEKLFRFCFSLFSSAINTELCICQKISESALLRLAEDYGEKIKLFFSEDRTSAINNAIKNASGNYIMFSDVNVTFASDCFETMLLKGQGNSCASNIALIENGNSVKLFRNGYNLNELSSVPVYCNYLLKSDLIRSANIVLTAPETISVMLFIADYQRYETPVCIDEVLLYTDSKKEYGIADTQTLETYANLFKATEINESVLYFLRLVVTAASDSTSNELKKVAKSVSSIFADNCAVRAWIEAEFDTDFSESTTSLHYKEIVLPMNKNDVIMNFYFGKFGVDVLKKCIGAWLHYKLYVRKDDIVKKVGCKLCRKLLGGEFDA